jgi:hypothetical protein
VTIEGGETQQSGQRLDEGALTRLFDTDLE